MEHLAWLENSLFGKEKDRAQRGLFSGGMKGYNDRNERGRVHHCAYSKERLAGQEPCSLRI